MIALRANGLRPFMQLTKYSAFLEFAGAFADLETIVVDLDLVVTPYEFAVLFPGELYGFDLAGFEVNGNLCGVDLVAVVAGSERAATKCRYGDGLAIGTGDANVYVGRTALRDTVRHIETDDELVNTTGGGRFFVLAVLLFVHRGDGDVGSIERRCDVYLLCQRLILRSAGCQVVGQLVLVLGQLLLVGGQLLVVRGELRYLLFQAAYFVVEFFDEALRFFFFSLGEFILAEQAADLLLEVSYLTVFFIDAGGELIVGFGEGIQAYECVVKILLQLSFFVGDLRDLGLLLGLNLFLFVVVPQQVPPSSEETGGQQADD